MRNGSRFEMMQTMRLRDARVDDYGRLFKTGQIASYYPSRLQHVSSVRSMSASAPTFRFASLILIFPSNCPCCRQRRIGALRRRLDRSQSMLRPLVALVGRLDIPHIGFQRIATAANSHLRKITNGILRLGQTCLRQNSPSECVDVPT